MPSRHLVFDVNETLLDLTPLDPLFARHLGDAGLRRTWFASLLHWSTVTTLTGHFMDFTTLAGDCLDAVARARGIDLDADAREAIFTAIGRLPPHPEVVPALERLRAAGFTLMALTNSAQQTVDAQFEHSGLSEYFEHVRSVAHARCYKPHPDAYAVATETLACAPESLCLVAAHDWDVTGAMRAGFDGAFVAREGAVHNNAGTLPTIVGDDLTSVTERLIAAYG